MSATPNTYSWLSSSPIGEAGCITVIAQSLLADVSNAFGAQQAPSSLRVDVSSLSEVGDWAWLSEVASPDTSLAATVVVEDNGFQGSRPEVLRLAARASRSGLAASIFWNVNGIVIFSCAKEGKPVATVELGLLEDEEAATLPRALRSLALAGNAVDGGLVSLGAAMVETFTGVHFTAEHVREGLPIKLTPPASDLDDYYTGSHVPFLDDYPDLLKRLVALPVDRQRLIAEWAVAAAVAEAGLANEPAVNAAIAQLGQAGLAQHMPGLDALRGRLANQELRIEYQEMDDGVFGGLESAYVSQKLWATAAVRQAAHENPRSAVVTSVKNLLGTVSCSKTERGIEFVENESGRHCVAAPDSVNLERRRRFVAVLQRMTESDPATWPAYAFDLPTPLTAPEREGALARDAERLAAGDFDEYDVVAVDDGEPWIE